MKSSALPPGVRGLAWFCVSSLAVPPAFCLWTGRPQRLDLTGLFIDNTALLISALPLLLMSPLWKLCASHRQRQWTLRTISVGALIATLCTPLWLFLADRSPVDGSALLREGLRMSVCCLLPALGLVRMRHTQQLEQASSSPAHSPSLGWSIRQLLVWGLHRESVHPCGFGAHLNRDRWTVVTSLVLLMSVGAAVAFYSILWPSSPALAICLIALHVVVMVGFWGDYRALSLPIFQPQQEGLRIQIGLRAIVDLSRGQAQRFKLGIGHRKNWKSSKGELNLGLLGEANIALDCSPEVRLGGLMCGSRTHRIRLGVVRYEGLEAAIDDQLRGSTDP